MTFFVKFEKNKTRTLSWLLTLWVYTYALFYFVPLIIPSTTMLMYIWLATIAVIVIFINKKISVGLLKFMMLYVLVALVNVAVVSYKYYVVIDAFSGFVIFIPALLIISSYQFNIEDFLNVWYKFAIAATVFSPVAIILMQKRIIDYGVFTYLNLPNCIAFSFIFSLVNKEDRRKKIGLFLSIFNFFIILFFGGRMAAFAAAFSVFLGYMLSSSANRIKKAIIIIMVGVMGVLIVNNLYSILVYANVILNKFNLNSRTFALLAEQIKASGNGLYMSGREVIYEEVVNYISQRAGLPGGFGVTLYISNGEYYHPHNLFLQLAVLFGIVGGILAVLVFVYRIFRVKKIYSHLEYIFTLFLILNYLVISFTGGSILNNYVAIMGIGMAFFYRGNQMTICD